MPSAVAVTDILGSNFHAKMTSKVIFCTIVASFGGLLFGYDLGISGGVTSMDTFLIKFFPHVYVKKHHARENNYCKFDDQKLQLFTSSLYLAAIFASLISSILSRKKGRKFSIQIASGFFIIGAIFNAFAQDLIMLIIGRLCLGIGLGFSNQSVPLFISEIAPAKHRGFLNIMFQLLITVGILVANLVNYGTSKLGHIGWRVSLGGAIVPALILFVGSLKIEDTPASLIERGETSKGYETLKKIRGADDDAVKAEYNEILRATQISNQIKRPFVELLTTRNNRPPLICAIAIHILQQFTGINVIMFYAPVLFQTMGFGRDASLLSAVITGVVNCLSTVISNVAVDKIGRKPLLVGGALVMIVGQCVVGGLLSVHLKTTNQISPTVAIVVVVFICLFVCAYAWSWGPLGWLVASEFFPLETRNAGYFFAVFSNMLCTFIIAQVFLTMLCTMRSAIFFFFTVWLVVSALGVYYMVPETKGIPMEEIVDRTWKKHWFWSRFYEAEKFDIEAKEFELAQI